MGFTAGFHHAVNLMKTGTRGFTSSAIPLGMRDDVNLQPPLFFDDGDSTCLECGLPAPRDGMHWWPSCRSSAKGRAR